MKTITITEALTTIILQTQKKALRQECERWEAKHINRLERGKTRTINTPEADAIREAFQESTRETI
jgi:hypothetical protein